MLSKKQHNAKIFFRVDSSDLIGQGHLMRCLALAKVLARFGADIIFVCRDLNGNWCEEVKKNGFILHLIRYEGEKANSDLDATATKEVISRYDNAAILIVDHYKLDIFWEKQLKQHIKIMVIDDLADRKHDCDILLDQDDLAGVQSKRYHGLIPEKCKTMFGPEYVMLKEEYDRAKIVARKREGDIRRVNVYFGSNDKTNELLKALNAVEQVFKCKVAVDVVMGKSNPFKEEILKKCRSLGAECYEKVDNLFELFLNADISIGAGGSTVWERAFLGLPSIVTVIADNQVDIVCELAQRGIVLIVGNASDTTETHYAVAIEKLCKDKEFYKQMSRNAYELVPVNGINDVAKCIFEEILNG